MLRRNAPNRLYFSLLCRSRKIGMSCASPIENIYTVRCLCGGESKSVLTEAKRRRFSMGGNGIKIVMHVITAYTVAGTMLSPS